MKVLHVIIGLNTGGAETMLLKLVESLNSHTHIVVSLTTEGDLGPSLSKNGVKVYSLNLRSSMLVPSCIYQLLRILRRECPDIVQTWMYHADLIGGLVAKLCGLPVIWGVRTTDLSQKGSRSTHLIRTCCAKLSRVIPSYVIYAAEASRHKHEQMGYCTEKSVVIPNGFQIERLSAAIHSRVKMRALFQIPDQSYVVGCVGRFHDDKDQHNFLRAAALLMTMGYRIVFLMIGRGLDTQNLELTDFINTLGLNGAVLLKGERPDIPECLSAMDVFCLPSKTEGFPNVLGEAMGVGIPCVTTDVGDTRAVLAECGLIVPKENPEELANAIARILELPKEERNSLCAAGKRRIYNHYSISSTCSKFERTYLSTIKNRSNKCVG